MADRKLPDGASRVRELVRRSAPNRNRPRLPDEYEDMLHDIDREMAATYASMEDVSDRIERCIDKLDDNGGVVVQPISNDDSLAVQVEDLADDAQDAISQRLPVVVGEIE